MAKKRGKKSNKRVLKKSKPSKKTYKSNFKEKKVKYSSVKSSVSSSKDPELNRELDELASHKYYGQKETIDSDYKLKENPVEKRPEKRKSYYQSKVYEERTYDNNVPSWFYMASIFAAFLFTIYISIFATLHFGDIIYMNIMIVFLFISMVTFFLISSVYFISEKRKYHAIVPALFFFGIASIMIYAFKAVNTSNLVRFSIVYTIIVVAVSTYLLVIKK